MKKFLKSSNRVFSILVALSLILNTIYIPLIAFAQDVGGESDPVTEGITEPEPEPEDTTTEEDVIIEEETPAEPEAVVEEEETPAEPEVVVEEEEALADEEVIEETIPEDETVDETETTPIVNEEIIIEETSETSDGGGSLEEDEEVSPLDEELQIPPIEELANELEEVIEAVDLENIFVEAEWTANEDGSFTMPELVVDKEYTAPQNPDVRLVFHTLPETGGSLTITEITLTPEQIEQTGALSEIAYDITSDMEDGTFSFDLTLPLPEEMQNEEVEVKSAESVDELGEAEVENKEQEKVDNTITIKGLDHFTVYYITTTPSPDTGVDVLINEVMVNSVGGADEWVELYNNSGGPVDFTIGWNIKDGSHSAESLSSLGTVLDGELAVFYHADEWLNDGGSETITINNGSVDIDSVEINTSGDTRIDHYPGEGESVGRTHDGGDDWFVFAIPTEGEPNVFTVCASGCDFDTVQGAVGRAGDGDTIKVLPGTYETTGQVLIDDDITIIGDLGSKPTIIPDSNLLGDNEDDAWFLVEDGTTFSLENVILDGGAVFVYQGIRSHGDTTITNVDFRNIQGSLGGSPYRGIAILSFGGVVGGGGGSDSHGSGGATSSMVVADSTFEQIGRVGMLIKGSDVTGDISGNVYTGKGSGDWLDYALDISAGAVVEVYGNEISENKGVAYDDSTSAGILVTTYWGSGTSSYIHDNDIHDNTDGIAVGYDGSDTSFVEANENEIYNNDSYGVFSTAPFVDAELNWWGDASGPNGVGPGSGDAVSANVDYCPWLDAEDGDPMGPCLGEIQGKKYIDSNQNGYQDESEKPGLSGWEIRLYSDSWEELDSMNTGDDGDVMYGGVEDDQFRFENLVEGTYMVCEVESDDYNQFAPITSGEYPKKTDGTDAHTNAVSVENDSSNKEEEGAFCWSVDVPASGDQIGYIKFGNIDNVPPTAPVITSPVNEDSFPTQPIKAEWDASTDVSGIDKYQIEYVYDDGHTFSGGPYREVPGTQTWRNHTPNTSEQGGVTIRVRAYDPFNNISEWSNSVHYYYDFEDPSVPVLTSPIGGITITDNTPLMQWEDSEDESGIAGYYYRVRYNCSDWNDVNTCSSLYPDTTGRWEIISELQAGPTSDGVYFWQVMAEDNAGRQSAWSDYKKVIINATPPAVPTWSGVRIGHNGGELLACGTEQNPAYTNTNKITLEWNINTDDTVSYWFGTKFNEEHQSFTHPNHVKKGNMSPGNNPYWYTVKAVDDAGNESALSEKCWVILDTETPEISLSVPVDGFVNGVVDITGTVIDDNPHHYWLAIYRDSDNSQVYGVVVNHSNSFTDQSLYLWDTTLVDDGDYTIKFAERDAADNRTSDFIVNVTVDNTKPETEWTGDIPGYINEDPVLHGTSTDDGSGIALVEYSIHDNTDAVVVDWTAADPDDGAFDGESSENFTVSPTGLEEGSYTFYARATDSVGNLESTAEVTIIIDKTAPEITLLGETPDEMSQGNEYNDPGYQESDNTGCIAEVEVTGISGVVNEPGIYVITYVVTDCAGNETTVTRTVNVNAISGGGGGFIGGGRPNNGPSLFDLIFGTTSGEVPETEGGENTGETGGQEQTTGGTTEGGTAESEAGQTTGDEDETNLDQTDNSQFAAAVSASGFWVDGWTWFWIILGLIVIALAIYFLYNKRKKGKDDDINPPYQGTSQV